MDAIATRENLGRYSHVVVIKDGKRTHYLRDNTTHKLLGNGIGESSLKPGVNIFSQLIFADVGNMSNYGRRVLERLGSELFTQEVIEGIYGLVLGLDPELKSVRNISYLEAVVAKNPTASATRPKGTKRGDEYRSKPLSVTRTVDLEAIKSKFAKLGTDVEEAISAQIEKYKTHETVNGHHAERLAGKRGVVLPEHTLLHGLKYNLDILRDIKKNGILAGEYYGHDDVTHGMADFWRMPEDTSLVDFIDRVKGRRQYVKAGVVKEVPLSKRFSATTEYGTTSTPTEEAQFLNLDGEGIAFIVDPEAAREFAGYDYFSDGQHPKALDKLVDDTNSANSYAKGRRSAILVGIPYSCFSGVVVGTKVASDPVKLQSIIDLFGEDLMIIAGDGRVLSVPPYAKQDVKIDELNAGCLKRKEELLDALPDEAMSRVESDSSMKWFFGQECIERRKGNEDYLD